LLGGLVVTQNARTLLESLQAALDAAQLELA
jgi:hypothetical protein